MIPTVRVIRYVTPLREGGSLPGIVEADDLGTYVCKFRGAGQGVRVLVAEVVVGELARRIGLRTPRLVALDLDAEIARYEADEEVQDLLNASPGLNLGVDFLPGAFGYDGIREKPDARRRRRWPPRCCGSTPSARTSTAAGATPTCWSGTATCGSSTTAPSLYFHHAWPGGVGDPAPLRAAAVERRRPRARRLPRRARGG